MVMYTILWRQLTLLSWIPSMGGWGGPPRVTEPVTNFEKMRTWNVYFEPAIFRKNCSTPVAALGTE